MSGSTAAGDGGLTDADRDAAVAALDVHREAGRLDDVGFEERSVRARRAWTRADLELLFLDLPEPHPVLGAPAWGSMPAPTSGPAPSGGPAGVPAPQPMSSPPVPAVPEREGGLLPPRFGRYAVALVPFLALAIFFSTGRWYAFLLIPVVAIIANGPDGGKRRRRR